MKSFTRNVTPLITKKFTLKDKTINDYKKVTMNVQQKSAVPAQMPPAPLVNPNLSTWEIEANQLGLQGEHRRLYKLLRDFHGFKKEQCITLRDQGYMTLSDLVDWEYKDV